MLQITEGEIGDCPGLKAASVVGMPSESTELVTLGVLYSRDRSRQKTFTGSFTVKTEVGTSQSKSCHPEMGVGDKWGELPSGGACFPLQSQPSDSTKDASAGVKSHLFTCHLRAFDMEIGETLASQKFNFRDCCTQHLWLRLEIPARVSEAADRVDKALGTSVALEVSNESCMILFLFVTGLSKQQEQQLYGILDFLLHVLKCILKPTFQTIV